MGRRANDQKSSKRNRDRTTSKEKRSRSRSRSRSHLSRSRSRSRSRSPRYPRLPRSPKQRGRRSLTAAKSLVGKKQRAPSSWDKAPLGYEHLTPVQYKAMQASGQIASRIVPDVLPAAESPALAMLTRQARRLYVGNIPFGVTDEEMINFFNIQLQSLGLKQFQDGTPVLTCQTNLEKNFAFLEFRSMGEATQAIAFDGVNFRGQTLKIRRPHDYHPVTNVSSLEAVGLTDTIVTSAHSPGPMKDLVSTLVPDSPQKIYIGSLPPCLDESQIKELLSSFGRLRGFNLVKDANSGLSKGYAFFEYVDSAVTDQAIAGLNGMLLGDRRLVVQRSIAGGRNANNHSPASVLQVPGFPAVFSTGAATEILCLLNMIQPEDLLDDEEYEDICVDIRQECDKHGKVKGLKIPRPLVGKTPNAGCGKVFVQFESMEDCQKALKALSGRKFNGRIVVTSFFNLDKYEKNEF